MVIVYCTCTCVCCTFRFWFSVSWPSTPPRSSINRYNSSLTISSLLSETPRWVEIIRTTCTFVSISLYLLVVIDVYVCVCVNFPLISAADSWACCVSVESLPQADCTEGVQGGCQLAQLSGKGRHLLLASLSPFPSSLSPPPSPSSIPPPPPPPLSLSLFISPVQRSYTEAISGMTEGSSQRDRGTSLGRDDRIHGSLLIINELIMNSAWSDEVWCGKGRQHRRFGTWSSNELVPRHALC